MAGLNFLDVIDSLKFWHICCLFVKFQSQLFQKHWTLYVDLILHLKKIKIKWYHLPFLRRSELELIFNDLFYLLPLRFSFFFKEERTSKWTTWLTWTLPWFEKKWGMRMHTHTITSQLFSSFSLTRSQYFPLAQKPQISRSFYRPLHTICTESMGKENKHFSVLKPNWFPCTWPIKDPELKVFISHLGGAAFVGLLFVPVYKLSMT